MNIAFDAKWFYDGNVSGRTVVINLIRKFATDHSGHTFYIILNKRDRIKKFPFDSKNIKLVYVSKILNNQFTNLFLFFQLRKYKLDIGVFQYYAPLFCTFKTVVYIHDIIFNSNPEYFTYKERVYFSSMKYFASMTDAIVTVSSTEKKRLLHYGYTSKLGLIDFVYNGVNDDFINKEFISDSQIIYIRNKYSLPDKYILYVGRLNNRKNLKGLIESLLHIKDTSIKLVLVGSSDWKMFDLEKVIDQFGVKSRVIQLGYINSDDLPLVYSACSVFCFVSFSEGFGIPVLEAMKCGVPVVVSGIDVFKELFFDIPYYVNPYSSKSIAEGIDSALNNDNNLRVQDGLRLANKFTWVESSRKLISFLGDILNR
jgi:glycosyltransferase involved in cell wall biosynthesis